jgi:hypothetical protein
MTRFPEEEQLRKAALSYWKRASLVGISGYTEAQIGRP